MEKIELKVYQTPKQFLEAYDFISWKEVKEQQIEKIGTKHVMLTAAHQLKNYSNGLGIMTYFETVAAHADFSHHRISYEMKTDYVLILNAANIHIENKDRELIKIDGHDSAYIGLGLSFGEPDRLVYNIDQIIQNLQDQGMTYEEAQEYFDYNILGAYLGEKMPVYVTNVALEEL